MKKIKTLFERDWEGDPSRVTRNLEAGLEPVVENAGVPTRKWDGTCCMVKDGILHARHDRKKHKKGKNKGQWKEEPPGWIPVEMDEKTGHWFGWRTVDFDSKDDWRHKEAWERQAGLPDGTYELIGPAVNGNPEKLNAHELVPHGKEILEFTFEPGRDPHEQLEEWFRGQDIEGIVWWKDEKPVAKIKKSDFNMGRED